MLYHHRESSWVIQNIETKEVIMETFQKTLIDKLNTTKYIAIPVHDYLAALNQSIKDDITADLK